MSIDTTNFRPRATNETSPWSSHILPGAGETVEFESTEISFHSARLFHLVEIAVASVPLSKLVEEAAIEHSQGKTEQFPV